MAKLSQLASGANTQTRIGLIPAAQLQLNPIPRPSSSTVTLAGAVAIGATTASVAALTQPLAKGTSLFFSTGAGAAPVGLIRLSAEAIVGATTLTITPTVNAFANGLTAVNPGMVCIRGLTSTGFSVANQEQSVAEITCTEDVVVGELSGFTQGTVNSSSWTMPLSGNARDNTLGYQILKVAANFASAGLYVYVEHETQALGGWTKSTMDAGVAQVTQFDVTSSADGFVTFSASLAGRGAPDLALPVAVVAV